MCIEREIPNKPIHRLPPSDCYYKCEDESGECGGGNAYNIYETQGGTLYILWYDQKPDIVLIEHSLILDRADH